MIAWLVQNLWWISGLLVMAGLIVNPVATWKLRWQLALLIALAYAITCWLDANALRLQIGSREVKTAVAALNYSESARTAEKGTGARVNTIDTKLQGDLDDEQANLAGVRAARDAGTLQLQPRLQCAPGAAGHAAATSIATSRGDEAGASEGLVPAANDALPLRGAGLLGPSVYAKGGVTRADEDFLLALAGKADDVGAQLTAAQELLVVYRDRCGVLTP